MHRSRNDRTRSCRVRDKLIGDLLLDQASRDSERNVLLPPVNIINLEMPDESGDRTTVTPDDTCQEGNSVDRTGGQREPWLLSQDLLVLCDRTIGRRSGDLKFRQAAKPVKPVAQ